jgi:flagellar biosynthetic protein FliO
MTETATRTLAFRRLFLLVCLLAAIAFVAARPAVCADQGTPAAKDFWSAYEDTGKAESKESGKPQENSLWLPMLRMVSALLLILGVIALIAWLVKRYAPGAVGRVSAKGDVIRVVATRLLGGRRSLMLVRVRGQTLLLGVTPQSIQCLTEIQELEGEWAQPPSGREKTPSAFNRQLGTLIEEVVADEPASSRHKPS